MGNTKGSTEREQRDMKGRGKLEQRRWISKEKGEKWNKVFVRPEKL